MKLSKLMMEMVIENDDEGGSMEADKKMTEKTVNDVFSLL
jgi:hypothetical protein